MRFKESRDFRGLGAADIWVGIFFRFGFDSSGRKK
jgi:hypothetical protein